MKHQRIYAARMNVARFESLLHEEHDPPKRRKLEEMLRMSREELDLAVVEADWPEAGQVDRRDREVVRASHWRSKAEELRATAETMHHPTSRETLTRLAQSYDLLARQAEERAEPLDSRQGSGSGDGAA